MILITLLCGTIRLIPLLNPLGGTFGVKFTNPESLASFHEAFNNVLTKFNVDKIHKNHLLYLIIFYGTDDEKMSLSDNEHNRLIEYVKFILNIHQNSVMHFNKYLKDKNYELIHDEGPNDYFFARKSLFKKYSPEDIAECRPNDEPGDTINYMRFFIGATELYVPYDLMFKLSSNHALRSFEGAIVTDFDIPPYLQSELFKYTFNFMIDAHKRADSPFYQTISTKPLSEDDFKILYNQHKRKSAKLNHGLYKIGTIISDYLIENKILKSKRTIASFLFNYFALFKILRVKGQQVLPESYGDLTSFYIKNNITPETVRLMMRDA
jgi:hypothetical protein